MADDLLSDADMGISAPAPDVAPSAAPASIATSDPASPSPPIYDDSDRPLTIRQGPQPVAATGQASGSGPALLSDADMGISPAPATTTPLGNSTDDGWGMGALKGAATGTIRGVSNAVGSVGNLSNLADLFMATAERPFTSGKSIAEIAADIKAQRQAQEAGSPILSAVPGPRSVLPDGNDISAPILAKTGAYAPTTYVGKLAQAGTEAVTGAFGPGMGGSPGSMLATAARTAPANFASGVGGQIGADVTGSPVGGFIGGLAGPAALASMARLGQKSPAAAGGNYFQGVNDDRIGRQLYGLASDPSAVRDIVAPTDLSSNPSSIAVPGFKPTTGQLTGDLGLLKSENQFRVGDNEALSERGGDQNKAAQSALRSIAAGADEMKPSTMLQQHLDTVDQATQQAQDRITAGAQQLAGQLGPGETADSLGATIRGKLDAAANHAAQLRSNLYAAVDPDGTVRAPGSPIRDTVKAIRRETSQYDEPHSEDEQRLYALGAKMPDYMAYRDIVKYDRSINSALPKATPEARTRLRTLKTAVMGVLNGTADAAAQREAGEVAAGTRSPADTVETRLQQVMPTSSNAPSAGSSVFTPSGRQIGVRYGVVDAGDLTASHRPDMTPNPDYPANLQPRDRSRAASEAQVADIAAKLQPERLGASASAAEGAPIVGPDGLVESGNGRVLAIQRAHAQGGPQAAAYRDFLASQGFDASGMKALVLVRHRVSDLSPEDRVRFAQEANASPVMSSSATERAATDAGRLSDGALGQYQGGDVSSAANRPFVRAFLKDAAEKSEAGSFATADGSLSLDGARRIQNALVHAGYGDSRLVSSLAETGDPDIAAFGHVMADQAGSMAQLRRGIASGDVHAGADLSAPVLEAGRVVQRARSNNMRLADAVAQQDAFNPISDEARAVLTAAYGPTLSSRLSRSRMGAYLQDALGEAQQQTAGGRLFGEPLTARQILKGAQARNAERTGTSDQVTNGGLDPGPGAGTAGQEGGRSGPGAGGSSGPGSSGESGVIPRPTVARTSDPAVAQRLRAAKDAHIDYVSRFDEGLVAKAIEKNAWGRFTRDASSVPGLAIRKGDAGYSTAKAYLRDSNNAPDVIEAMTDRALAPLRASLTPQGTISPKAYATWKADYGPALRALNEADPGFASRYDNAAKATELMIRAGAMRERALDGFRKGVAAKFLGLNDPSEVQAAVGRIIDTKANAVTRMRQLIDRLKDPRDGQIDPEALDGLRRAGAAFLSEKFSNAAKEAATDEHTMSTRLPKDVAARRAVLSELFDDKQLGRITAVAHVLDQKQRSADALKNKGNSQTSRDTANLIKKGAEKAGHAGVMTTVLALAADHALEGIMEHGLSGVLSPEVGIGAVGGGALLALNKLRTKNARADQAAIQDALLNPERFAHYTTRVSPDEAERRGAALAAMIRRQLITMPMVERTVDAKAKAKKKVPAYATGGATGSVPRSTVYPDAERIAAGMLDQVARIRAEFGCQSGAAANQVSAAGYA